MAPVRAAVTNVTAGVLARKMLGRADLARYVNGCLVLENMGVDPTGEWWAREAFVYLATRKYADRAAVPVPFVRSVEQAYLLEFGHQYMRVLKDGGLVLDGGGPIYDLATPYSESDLGGLRWTQSVDVLYLLHELHEPRQLIRRDHDDWAISVFELQDGPYLKENADTAKHLIASGGSYATGDLCTVTATGHAPFTEESVGRLIRWNLGGGSWSWLKVEGYTSTTVVSARVKGAALGAVLDVTSWRLGVYYMNHWPTAGRLIDGRLVFGGSEEAPDRTDGSANSDYPNLKPGTNEADAYSWTLASDQLNRIHGYAQAGEMVILTAGALWRMSGSSERDAITPTSVSAKKLSGHGSARLPPQEVSDAVVWIDRSKRKILRLQFNPDGLSGWSVNDLTVLSDEIGGNDPDTFGFVQLCWQESPKPTLWCLRRDGRLAALTYMPEEKVNAWQVHLTADGDVFEKICVVPNASGNDELYAFVKRAIGGSYVRTIERLQWDNLLRTPPQQKRLDGCLTYENAPAGTLTLAAVSGDAVAALSSVDCFEAAHTANGGEDVRICMQDGVDDDGEPIWRWCVGRITARADARNVTLKVLAPFKATILAAGQWRITTRRVTGADLYNGTSVSAQIDGMPAHDLAVADGAVVLPARGSIVHIGRRYTAKGLTMPIDVGQPPGTGQAKESRIDRIMVRVRESIGGKVGAWKKGEPIKWERVGQLTWDWEVGKPPVPKSEDHSVNATGPWTKRPQVIFQQDEPLPFNMQLVNPSIYAPWQQP